MKMKHILSILALMVSISLVGQESKYKSLFMYKFLQNIEWPSTKVSDTYIIAVYGDAEVLDQVQSLTSGRSVNGKPIEVVSYVGTLDAIHMLYLATSEHAQFESLNTEAKANAVALVASTPGAAKDGAAINFVSQGGRIKFEMNPETLESSGLKASGSIKSLAVLVN